jgi:hypothetical protein
MAMTSVARALAPDVGCAQEVGEKTVTVKDGWGNETTVKGFQEEHQAGSKWFIHDPGRPQPRAVEPGPSSTLGAKPPEGPVILFDGTDPSGWTGGPWRVAEGYMEVKGTGGHHVEGRIRRRPVARRVRHSGRAEGRRAGPEEQWRVPRYEIQVLDNWKAATYADAMVGAV